MKLLVSDVGNVDFDGPLKLSPDQRDELVKWLRERFACVQVERVDSGDLRSWRLGERRVVRQWSICEDRVVVKSTLTEPMSTEDLGRNLARGWMSVNMRRAGVMNDLGAFARRHGVDVHAIPDTPEARAALEKVIELYLADRERQEQYGDETLDDQRDRLYSEIASLENKLRGLNTTKKWLKPEQYETNVRAFQERIVELRARIKELERQLAEGE